MAKENEMKPYEGYSDLEGNEIVETRHCDTCEFCEMDCTKLILPEGKHICVI